MKKNIFIITGGAGFIGSHIAQRLIGLGQKVIILDNLSTGNIKNIHPKADFIKIDLSDKKAYAKLKAEKCSAVLHLAGQSSGEASFKNPLYDLQSHVLSTFFLLNWCKENKVNRFLYASSMSVYGDASYLPVDELHPLQPKTFYGAAKASAENYIRLYQTLGMNTTIFRLFSVFGPGQNLKNKMQGMVSIYLSYMLENKPIVVKGSAQRFRDLVYIEDVVDVWIKSIRNPVTFGKTYNIASGKKMKVSEVIRLLKDTYGRPDYPVEFRQGTPGDQFGLVANIKKISCALKWKPRVSLKTGLKCMVDFEKRRLIS